MQNIEIKARGRDRPALEARLRAMGARREWTRRQADSFFAVPRGWLKLRRVEDGASEVISYRRPVDDAGPRASDYDVIPVADPDGWSRLLGRVLDPAGEVAKERTLWMWSHTRIHLDRVEGLGEFVELETVVRGISPGEAREEARQVLDALGIRPEDLVAVPYRDLLAARCPPTGRPG
jgi:predicted adenylyl cyclase CyaB